MYRKNFKLKKIQSQKNLITKGARNTCFLHFKRGYLAIYMVKVSKISTKFFYTCLVQDPMVRYAKEKF